METIIRLQDFPLENITNKIICLGIEIHKILGCGFSEIVYKDAFEYEFLSNDIIFAREREYKVQYKKILLKHKFFADFVVLNQVILEIKAKESFADEDYAQTINYLKCSGLKVGLILNFGLKRLGIKRTHSAFNGKEG